MSLVYFEANSIGALANLLATLGIILYIRQIPNRARHHTYLSLSLSSSFAFLLTYVLQTSLAHAIWVDSFIPLQHIAGWASAYLGLNFVLSFPDDSHKTGIKINNYIALPVSLLMLFFTYQFINDSFQTSFANGTWVGLISLTSLIYYIPIITFCLWESYRRSKQAANQNVKFWDVIISPLSPAAKVLRNFAIIYILVLSLAGLNVLFSIALIPANSYYNLFHTILLIVYISLTITYLNFLPDDTSFMPKLQLATLLIVLATISGIGRIVSSQTAANNRISQRALVDLFVAETPSSESLALFSQNLDADSQLQYIIQYSADQFLTAKSPGSVEIIYNRSELSLTNFDEGMFVASSEQQIANLSFWREDDPSLRAVFFRDIKQSLVRANHESKTHDVYIVEEGDTLYEFGFDHFAHLQKIHDTANIFIITILISIAVIFYLFPIFFTRILIAPLQRLLVGVQEVDRGELNYRVPVTYSDEIGRITRTFNHMTSSVNEKNAELEEANRTLEEKVVERTAELAQATDEAVEARKEAEQANLAKSSFLANMSHEIRTPLNAIIGYSEMLSEDAEIDGNQEATEDLQKIERSGRHLLSLINDILDISKIESGQIEMFYEEFKLDVLVDEVQLMMGNLVEQNGNTLQIEYRSNHTAIHADFTRTRQILLNLISNAAKFTQKGTITIEVTDGVANHVPVYHIAIRDTGIGISPQQINKIFEPFKQATSDTVRNYGGTGLGLAISRHFAHLMDGDIFLESALGKGSTFTVQIPMEHRKKAEEE